MQPTYTQYLTKDSIQEYNEAGWQLTAEHDSFAVRGRNKHINPTLEEQNADHKKI
jgi:hypothetical protein